MIEAIRAFLDRPLDPRHARAVVLLATCLTVAFASLVALGVITGSRPDPSSAHGPARAVAPTAPPASAPSGGPSVERGPDPRPRSSHGHSDVYLPQAHHKGSRVRGGLRHLPARRGSRRAR